jgi:membrane-associated phospholipid phosphatase
MTKLAMTSGLEYKAQPQSKLSRLWRYISQDTDIYYFFSRNIAASYTREEAVIHGLVGLLLIGALSLLTINQVFFHFTVWPIPLEMFTGVPLLFLFWMVIGHVHRVKWPRFGLIAITSSKIGLYITVCTLCCLGALTTPFMIIDHHLVHFDKMLGMDVTQLMAWAYQYPWLIKVLNFSYNSWYFEVIGTPIALALLKKSEEINRYYIGTFICLIFIMVIFYFFPTIAPAGVMSSPFFGQDQHDLVQRFYEIHQRLPITVFDGGVIGFPSPHVIMSLLVLVAWRKIKIAFYPLVILNAFLILSTMALGYHYLADVLASTLIVSVALTAIHFLYKKFFYPTRESQSQSLAIKNS